MHIDKVNMADFAKKFSLLEPDKKQIKDIKIKTLGIKYGKEKKRKYKTKHYIKKINEY